MEPEDLISHTEGMRNAARSAHSCRMPFTDLPPGEHRDALIQAVNNVLATELALFTFAQIVDGLPTGEVAWDRRYPGIPVDHIIEDVHEKLCDGAMDKARELSRIWDPSILMFSPKALKEFLGATLGSKPFNLRLIELVAVSVHQLAAEVSKLDLRLHKGDVDAVMNWTYPAGEEPRGWFPMPARPTLFNHQDYLDDDVYPEGVADVVGYWAEDRIFGGVPVFDRKEPAAEDPPNVYWLSGRDMVTDRLYQLLDAQQQSLLDFLLAKPDHLPSCPLPIIGGPDNRVRVSAPLAIIVHRVYRDEWERKPPTKDYLRKMNRRPRDQIDYPEVWDQIFRVNKQLGVPLPQPRPRSPSTEGEAPPPLSDLEDGMD